MGNGVLKNGVDYGEENNILDIGDALLRRDTGELIGYSKTPNYEFHVLTHHHAGVFLVYWDIELQRGIVYQYSKEKKEFEAKKGPYGEVCFIYSWAQA